LINRPYALDKIKGEKGHLSLPLYVLSKETFLFYKKRFACFAHKVCNISD